MVRQFIERAKESLETKLDYWKRIDLAVQGDILSFVAQRNSRYVSLCTDSYFIAALYATVPGSDLSPAHYAAQVRAIHPSYDPLQRYTVLLSHFYSLDSEAVDSLPRQERKVLQGLERFTRRYPDFDYFAFCAQYFPAAFAASARSEIPQSILPFRQTA